MHNEKYLTWFFSDISLDGTLSPHSFIIEKLSENFEKFYMINYVFFTVAFIYKYK